MSTVRVHFKDNKTAAAANWLILTSNEEGFSKTVGHRPVRDMIIDIRALKLFIEAGIKVYPPTQEGKKPSYKKELDIKRLMETGSAPLKEVSE